MIERHQSTTHLLGYFTYDHLPPHLAAISEPFANLADDVVSRLPDGPELTAGLRKLLEAKDCMVRAAVALERTHNRYSPPREVPPGRNQHCVNCGDTRGGPIGHETSECTYPGERGRERMRPMDDGRQP